MESSESTKDPQGGTGVILFFSGLALLIGGIIYAYRAATQRESDCRVDSMFSAMKGEDADTCATGVPVAAWFIIGVAILLLVVGIVLVVLPRRALEVAPRGSHPTHESVEDRLSSLEALLENGVITRDEYDKSRDEILKSI